MHIEFKDGDRVRVLSSSKWFKDLVSTTGVVVCRGSLGDIGIKFDSMVSSGKGHNLGGYLDDEDDGYGYWIHENDLVYNKGGNFNAY